MENFREKINKPITQSEETDIEDKWKGVQNVMSEGAQILKKEREKKVKPDTMRSVNKQLKEGGKLEK